MKSIFVKFGSINIVFAEEFNALRFSSALAFVTNVLYIHFQIFPSFHSLHLQLKRPSPSGVTSSAFEDSGQKKERRQSETSIGRIKNFISFCLQYYFSLSSYLLSLTNTNVGTIAFAFVQLEIYNR